MSRGFSIRSCKLPVLLIAALSAWSCPAASSAQAPAPVMRQRVPEGAGIVDQIVSINFDPAAAFLLLETETGRVKQYPAAAAELPPQESVSSARPHLILGSAVEMPPPRKEGEAFHFSFFMAGSDSAFAASEVKKWSLQELGRNTVSVKSLVQRIAQYEEKVRLASAKHEALQADLSDLRRQASQIGEINDIVNLKMRLNSLRTAYAAKERQTERLRKLIDSGRQIEDPEGIDQQRLELAAALTEAAKVTAIADRLAKRQQDAARQTFLRKISIVQELDETNPEELAREVLLLRKQRRDLESRLGIAPAESRNEEF